MQKYIFNIIVISVLNINNNINANNNNNNLVNLNLGNNNNVVTNLNQNVGNNFNLMFPPGRRRKRSQVKKEEKSIIEDLETTEVFKMRGRIKHYIFNSV